MRVLVTGAAGFIGFHLTRKLLAEKYVVLGVDNLNSYYAPKLKMDRLKLLQQHEGFEFFEQDLNSPRFLGIVMDFLPDVIVHLAAQAGVRYSITNPSAYAHSNLLGFQQVLEAVRNVRPKHFIYASSSSVYGENPKIPFSTQDRTDHPVSLYGATKKANEVMAHSYAHLFQIPTTGLRFFTVYGSWGRPDMAYFSFSRKILKGEPIELFNHGKMLRDFTHVSDIVESIYRLLSLPPEKKVPLKTPAVVYNIGAHRPVELGQFVDALAGVIGKKPLIKYLPMQAGDVEKTFADVSDLIEFTQYEPKVTLDEGLAEFGRWFLSYQDQLDS